MKKLFFKSRKTRQDILVEDIRNTRQKIDYAVMRFGQHTDDDLICREIYEIQALNAEYSYLLKLAKKENVHADLSSEAAMEKMEAKTVG